MSTFYAKLTFNMNTFLDSSKRIIVENNFFSILFLVPSLVLLCVESFFLLCNRLYGVRLIIFRDFFNILFTEQVFLRRM